MIPLPPKSSPFYKQSPRHGILRWCMELGNRNVTNGTDMIWEPLTKTENPQPLWSYLPIIYKKKVKITDNLPVNNR